MQAVPPLAASLSLSGITHPALQQPGEREIAPGELVCAVPHTAFVAENAGDFVLNTGESQFQVLGMDGTRPRRAAQTIAGRAVR
jgi:hypothetical protein